MKTTRLSTEAAAKRPFSGSAAQFRRKAVALGVAMAIASPAYANPTGMSVAAGQATAQTIGNVLQITNTPGAILNWQQFNIEAGQTTQFIQQSAASQVFNRVTGGDVSQILGTLQSNGQVFLINPAGVFFGQGAVIDTAGFLASTLAASDIDLLNGHLRFNDATGNAGGIVNQGTLTTHSGGSIVLLAPSIENSGIVHADGEVLLAAGHSVTIVDMKHPTIGLSVTVKEGEQAVNLGQIIGKNASLFSHLIKNTGVVEATGAQVGQGGVIRFIAKGDALVGGKLLAQSDTGVGGEIDITGQRVAVLNGARVSADGAAGGGTVHIGGGWQGQDDSLANAQQTVVQANTNISANATVHGDGGEVVVWADGHSVIDAEVQAKGGALGGNGGRVETSGKESLAVNVAANTSAPNGKSGLWLIDPANLTIVDQIPMGGSNLESSSSTPPFSTDAIFSTPSPTESFLLASSVVNGLENNGFVKILTTGSNPGAGNLTIAAPILVDQNFTSDPDLVPNLALQAKGEINIDAAVGLAPGQTAFTGFDLLISYDIAKPVYVDAPLYLGETGTLTLAPFETSATLPTNVAGQLPLDGVNFLSGLSNPNSSQPLVLNEVTVTSAVTVDQNMPPNMVVGPGKPVKLNILGANVAINQLNAGGGVDTPETDVFVGADTFDSMAPVLGNFSYNQLNARSLTVEQASTVSTFVRTILDQNQQPLPLPSNTFLRQLNTAGTFNFNGGAASISELNVTDGTVNFAHSPNTSSTGFFLVDNLSLGSTATLNLAGAGLQYGQATIDGVFNVMAGPSALFSFVDGVDTNLNGTMNIGEGSRNFVYLQSLGMGAASQIRIGKFAFLGLGKSFSSSVQAPQILPKQQGAYISSTNGQFVAQQGAKIIMDGSNSPQETIVLPAQQSFSLSSAPPNVGATLDITGLDGRLDAPVIIESNAYLNRIQSESDNFDFNNSMSTAFPINTIQIANADIRVNAGGVGKGLTIGQFEFSESQVIDPRFDFKPTVDLDFDATLTVNSGNAVLLGRNVSTVDADVSVNGGSSQITLDGRFTSADLYKINRSNGGLVGAEGFWDNSAVNANNLSSASPLAKGSIRVKDDLVISGGVLSSAGASSAIHVAPEAVLELRSTEVSTTINLDPTSALILGLQDTAGVATAPVVLNGANINMGGDAFLLVEADAGGVANLEGTATISSGHQGNLILAGRRVFNSTLVNAVPDDMSLNVGTGIRLNVTGNQSSLPAGLGFYYSQTGVATPPQRPVFLVGQLTPEAVSIVEYENFFGQSTPQSTILNGFANPSFVIDGKPDSANQGTLNCTVNNFCVKFDVAQNLTYSGMVMSSLGAPMPTLANSGVAFVAGANLQGVQFAVQTPDTIRFMSGVNVVTVADLVSGKSLVNGASSVVIFGSNMANESISNNIENNGVVELQGDYTLNGLITGSGTLSNSGNLVLGNGAGSLISNTIVNNGTIINTGSYVFANGVSGTGIFVNNGALNLIGSSSFGSFINSSNLALNSGTFNFGSGYSQTSGTFSVSPGAVLGGNINIDGGIFRGFATINGSLNVQGGRLIPGASPGTMFVSGDLNLDANSVIDIEIQANGGMPGVDFDYIAVSGSANLAGQLNLIDISGATLGVGNEYPFLAASVINGSFANVAKVNTGATYTFTDPSMVTFNGLSSLSTSTIAQATMNIGSGNTGDTIISVVNQNLDQAFTTPPTTTTTTQPSNNNEVVLTPTQEEEVVEAANQVAAGTTISQRSSNIELQTTPSNPQRAAAVCK